MKRLISVVILLAVIISLSLMQANTFNKYYKMISVGLDEIVAECESKNYINAGKNAAALENEWIKCERKLSFFFDNADIRELGTAISSLKDLASENSKENLLSQISVVRVMLIHIKNANRVSIYSIF